MKNFEASGAVRPIYGSLGVKRLKEENGLKVVENGVLWKIFGFMSEEVTEEWSKYVARDFILWAPHQTKFGSSNRGRWG